MLMKSNHWMVLCVVLVCSLAVYRSAFAGDGPVAYWSFNEDQGATLFDRVGDQDGLFQNQGILYALGSDTNGLYTIRSGKNSFGDAIHFDGDDTVMLGKPTILHLEKRPFSVVGWFKLDPVTGNEHRALFSYAKHRAGGIGVIVVRGGHSKRGRLSFEVKGSGDGNRQVLSNRRIDDGKWHSYVGTSDGQTMSLYIDGVKQAKQDTYTVSTTATPPAHAHAVIGQKFIGDLDELAVFDRVLSEAEIKQVHQQGMAAFGYQTDEKPSDADLQSAGPAKITAKETVLFDGDQGWLHNGITYRLACAAIMTEAPNGDLLVAWLSGSGKEPATDNCALLARSSDGGKTWSEPEIIVPAGEQAGIVTNLYTTDDGKVVLLGAHWPSDKKYTEWHYFSRVSEDSGKTWGKPYPFKINKGYAALGHGQRPLTLDNGETFFVGQFYRKRNKRLIAPAGALAFAKNETDALRMPKGKGRDSGKFGEYHHGFVGVKVDSPVVRSTEMLGKADNRPLGLLEPTGIVLKHGTISVLMRAEWGGYLWRADSTDNGRTWSRAYPTKIPNPSALIDLTRLPDGRIALLHNPSGGQVGERAKRSPMSLWISDDEMQSWSVKADLLHGGKRAYPNGTILKDGRLVFVYDNNRRQVCFVEVTLP
ncbi:exo-alpha-sialidase [Poriferisphaera sp. WC338]|uniref:exo-alpha-sialidase n=1 Tax=Poriferisphaera sp. WC338 TaxID=3425129 RepID=UPI003D816FA8